MDAAARSGIVRCHAARRGISRSTNRKYRRLFSSAANDTIQNPAKPLAWQGSLLRTARRAYYISDHFNGLTLAGSSRGPYPRNQLPRQPAEQGMLRHKRKGRGTGRCRLGYVQTLVMTDIATGWTECVPLSTAGATSSDEGSRRRARTFSVSGVRNRRDNDSAFINETVKAYCAELGIELRVGPYPEG